MTESVSSHVDETKKELVEEEEYVKVNIEKELDYLKWQNEASRIKSLQPKDIDSMRNIWREMDQFKTRGQCVLDLIEEKEKEEKTIAEKYFKFGMEKAKEIFVEHLKSIDTLDLDNIETEKKVSTSEKVEESKEESKEKDEDECEDECENECEDECEDECEGKDIECCCDCDQEISECKCEEEIEEEYCIDCDQEINNCKCEEEDELIECCCDCDQEINECTCDDFHSVCEDCDKTDCECDEEDEKDEDEKKVPINNEDMKVEDENEKKVQVNNEEIDKGCECDECLEEEHCGDCDKTDCECDDDEEDDDKSSSTEKKVPINNEDMNDSTEKKVPINNEDMNDLDCECECDECSEEKHFLCDDCVYNSRVLIYCNSHKRYFLQYPNNHLTSSGCPYCALDLRSTLKLQEETLKRQEEKINTLSNLNEELLKLHLKQFSYWEPLYNRTGLIEDKLKTILIYWETLDRRIGVIEDELKQNLIGFRKDITQN